MIQSGAQVICGGVFKPEAERLRAVALGLYKKISAGDQAAAGLLPIFEEWGGARFDMALPLDPTLTRVVSQVLAKFSSIVGGDWQHHMDTSFFRRLKPDATVTWHCDAEAATSFPLDVECVTLWMPLETVGVHTSPSLEFVLGSHDVMRRRDDLRSTRHRSDDFVDGLDGERFVPALNFGDAVMFDGLTLHRTEQRKAKRPRMSAELRFTKTESVT